MSTESDRTLALIQNLLQLYEGSMKVKPEVVQAVEVKQNDAEGQNCSQQLHIKAELSTDDYVLGQVVVEDDQSDSLSEAERHDYDRWWGVITGVFGRRQVGDRISYLVSWEGHDVQGNPWPRTWNDVQDCRVQDSWGDLLAVYVEESDFVPESSSSSSDDESSSSSSEDESSKRRRKRKLPPLGVPPHGGKRGPPPPPPLTPLLSPFGEVWGVF